MLAQQFRRRINIGVAVAAVIVLLVTLVAGVAAWRGDDQNDSLRTNELKTALDQSAARTAANDAKANESLRLIKRGSGDLYESPWKEDAQTVEDRSDPSLLDDWRSYTEAHASIMKFEEADLHTHAVALATTESDRGSTAPFQSFDDASAKIISDNGDATTDALRSGRSIALIGSLLTVLLGVVAAVAVARGMGARRKEYA